MVEQYLNLLQIAAVTAVACVLIVGGAGDLFSLEETGKEAGTGKPIMSTKYRTMWGSTSRGFVFFMGLFMAAAYTTLLSIIIYSVSIEPGYMPAATLRDYFAIVVSVTIMMACWLAILAVFVRYGYMRSGGNPMVATT